MLPTLIILTAIFAAPMRAQDALPDAEGKPVTVRICTGCHGAEMFASARRSPNEWDQTITTMTEKGLAISDADYAAVLDYLSKNLAPAPPKVNVNKATAAELEKALAISTKQAEAIVACRVTNGDFKDLDGLKKVEGLDAAAVEAKKDRLQF